MCGHTLFHACKLQSTIADIRPQTILVHAIADNPLYLPHGSVWAYMGERTHYITPEGKLHLKDKEIAIARV